MDGKDLFVPASTRQKGEQQALCAPKLAQTLSTRTVLLGLPRSYLSPSCLEQLSECAVGMKRLLHVLLTWPVCVDPLAGAQAQGQVPCERTTPKRFSPGLRRTVRGLRYTRRECLQTGLWKQPGRSSSGRGPVLLRGPTGQWLNPARHLPMGSLAQIFLASSSTAP